MYSGASGEEEMAKKANSRWKLAVPSKSAGENIPWQRWHWAITVAFFLLELAIPWCSAETQFILCNEGNGSFETKFRTGVKVHIGPTKIGDLSSRFCEAILSWNKQSTIVTTESYQVDLDAFGIDVGMGAPVAAFQVKRTADDCCMEYRIYSLSEPPQLLRTISGGGFFKAADTDLDAHVEIWAEDVHAADRLQELSLGDFDAPPTIVLRFEHGELRNVGSEFRGFFDKEIAELRKRTLPADLQELKTFDLKSVSASAERRRHLRETKAKIVEIVWCYLYSGREQEAWRALSDMWPTGDADKIRAEIIAARSQGISAQVVGVSNKVREGRPKNAMIFDSIAQFGGRMPEVLPPEPIMLQRPTPSEPPDHNLPQEVYLELVVDSAGKVRSVDSADKVKSMDPRLVEATQGWKFIPTFKDGRAAACRTRILVSPRR
jgi:hypothetical protein